MPSCLEMRYDQETASAIIRQTYMPLSEQLATVIATDSKRAKLLTFSDREGTESNTIKDFFDGYAYQNQKALFLESSI